MVIGRSLRPSGPAGADDPPGLERIGLVSETVKKLSCLRGLEHRLTGASIRIGHVEILLISA
jgi:hypothetical protein